MHITIKKLETFHRLWAAGDNYFKKENKPAEALECFKAALPYANPEDAYFKRNCSTLHYNIALVLEQVCSHNYLQQKQPNFILKK